jgi:flavin reductase (DIM6/NTAB) family NADH-FMN oxidoreductase RutF
MSVSAVDFRQIMSMWTTGVVIVTSANHQIRRGMTVSSFTSISTEPPLILISLWTTSKAAQLVAATKIFGVTILERQQKSIAEIFAGKIPEDGDRFAGLTTFTLTTGASFFQGGLAYLDCLVTQSIPAGANTVFFGEVQTTQIGDAGKPLVYTRRAYQSLQI